MPSLQHYVVHDPSKVEIRSYERSRDWAEDIVVGADAILHLAPLGLKLSATVICSGTGLA